MATVLQGSLLDVIKISSVAWYIGPDETKAYYEQPVVVDKPNLMDPQIYTSGRVYVNGEKVCHLKLDADGTYWYKPSPDTLKILAKHGVMIDCGWHCHHESTSILSVTAALDASPFHAASHQNGHIAIQRINDQAVVFIQGQRRWTLDASQIAHGITEMSVEAWCGWYPVQQDLIQLYEGADVQKCQADYQKAK